MSFSAVTEEQSRPKEAAKNETSLTRIGETPLRREDSALALIVDTHDDREVLERENAEDVLAHHCQALVVERLTQRVQGAGADIAVNDAQSTERHRRQIGGASKARRWAS